MQAAVNMYNPHSQSLHNEVRRLFARINISCMRAVKSNMKKKTGNGAHLSRDSTKNQEDRRNQDLFLSQKLKYVLSRNFLSKSFLTTVCCMILLVHTILCCVMLWYVIPGSPSPSFQVYPSHSLSLPPSISRDLSLSPSRCLFHSLSQLFNSKLSTSKTTNRRNRFGIPLIATFSTFLFKWY